MGGVRTLGIVLTVLGAASLVIGLDSSHSLFDQGSAILIGGFTQGAMPYIVGGLAAVAAGSLMARTGGR